MKCFLFDLHAVLCCPADAQRPFRAFRKRNAIVLDVGESRMFDSTQARYSSILHVSDSW